MFPRQSSGRKGLYLPPGPQRLEKRHRFVDNDNHRVYKSSRQDMLMNCIKDKEKNHGNHPVIRIP